MTHGAKLCSLPFGLGGLGLHSSYYSASAACLGSCNNIDLLTSQLLSQDFHGIDEDHAVSMYEEHSSTY